MTVQTWTFTLVGLTFALYLIIAVRSRAASTTEFYVAGGGVPPLANGMATAADWMSAASFLSMAGLISFTGYDGSVYLLGWTGGYVLLAILIAPYLRRFGKYTVPDFIGDRYYGRSARLVAVVAALFISFTYVAGQMRGVGVVFSRFLEVPVNTGVVIGMAIVFVYAVLGGMKGITYTQVAQYCILITAFLVPAIFLSIMMTGEVVPQIGFGAEAIGTGQSLLAKLDGLHTELGFAPYTDGTKSMLDMFCITMALMVGTAGLPHVIVRFYTVPRVRDARISAFWALLFIAILYTAAPAVAAFARTNLIESVEGAPYSSDAALEGETPLPDWFKNWEDTDLIVWVDKNGDGRVQYRPGHAFAALPGQTKAKPVFVAAPEDSAGRGDHGQRLVQNAPTAGDNELYVDRDIMVLAAPEIAALPNWVIALVAAGGLAAALSTAAGLLLVVSSAISHDLLKRGFARDLSEKGELLAARASAAVAVVVAGYLGIHPPGFVAEVVAFAFGLAASSFFPAIVLGIFWKRTTRAGAVWGMVAGLTFTVGYIVHFKFLGGDPADLWFGISPEGIGTLGMLVNTAITVGVTLLTPPPPPEIAELVESVRTPRQALPLEPKPYSPRR